jgi:hypothetical protein
MKSLLVIMMLLGSNAFAQAAAPVFYGQLFAGSSQDNSGVDRAVLGLSQQLEGDWQLNLAGNMVQNPKLVQSPSMFNAYLKGNAFVAGDSLSVGFQQDHYAAFAESKLHSNWLTPTFAQSILVNRDMILSYSGVSQYVDYSVQVSDEVKGDSMSAYSLLLTHSFTQADVAVLARYSPAFKTWTYDLSGFGKFANYTAGIELSQEVPKDADKSFSYALTGGYTDEHKTGVYIQYLAGDATWKLTHTESLNFGPTYAINKQINIAALISHMNNSDGMIARIAATF